MPAFYDRQVQVRNQILGFSSSRSLGSKFPIFQVVRHIGLLEGIITLLILASFIQYGMGWANYLEQKFLAPKPKEKKVKKVKKSEVKEETKEAVDEFEHLKPSVYDTLPFQLYELCKQSPELIEYAKVREETKSLKIHSFNTSLAGLLEGEAAEEGGGGGCRGGGAVVEREAGGEEGWQEEGHP